MRKSSRAVGVALAFALLCLAGSGCRPPQPKEAAASLKSAEELDKGGKKAEALDKYREAAQFDARGATAPEAYVRWGQLALELNKPDQAVMAFQTLERAPLSGVVKTPSGVITLPDDNDKLYNQAMSIEDRIKSGHITYRVMDTLVRLTGKHPEFSYWIAIFLFTLTLKLILTPLTLTQLRSSRKMMFIQPKLKEIQDRYRDRPEELNRRMMALYKEEGVNPLGCGSGMILQMAVIFALYRVILDYQFQFTNGHFLWVGSFLARQFPNIVATSLAKPDMPLLIIYAISMFVQSRMTMVPTLDPNQAQQQKMMAYMMPLMLLTVLKSFPSAFTLYWLLFNMMSSYQQLRINKQLDAEMGSRPSSGGSSLAKEDPPKPAPKPQPKKKQRNSYKKR